MSISRWWKGFKAHHIEDPEAFTWTASQGDVKASDVLATKTVTRVILTMCHRPDGKMQSGPLSGTRVLGWQVSAHNDGERAEVLVAWIRSRNREGAST